MIRLRLLDASIRILDAAYLLTLVGSSALGRLNFRIWHLRDDLIDRASPQDLDATNERTIQ